MNYILSAPIQSGKTTSLINWSAARKDVYGILTPVVGGKRVFMNAQTKEHFPMEATGDEEYFTIGSYVFSKAGFDKSILIIRNAIHNDGWLVIDEIGPLELDRKGFYNIVNEMLALRKNKTILVIREGLAEQVKDFFMFNATEVSSIDKI